MFAGVTLKGGKVTVPPCSAVSSSHTDEESTLDEKSTESVSVSTEELMMAFASKANRKVSDTWNGKRWKIFIVIT